MTQTRNSLLFKFAILVLFILSITVIWNKAIQKADVPQALQGVLRPEPRLLKPFDLLNQNGQLINEQMFKDKWTFVFLGYTSCPDICPVTLHVLNAVMGMLEKENAEALSDTQVVFVSVDPERDTVESLSDYVTFFNKDFIGLTGDKENIDNFSKQLGAGYMIGQETSPGEYLVAHTSAIFLVAPDTAMVAAFSQPHNPGTIVSLYKKVRSYILK